ncbi:LOB domain-containing protein 19 [Silene latifolia]|uniref:LOB domain-containing protein 19 n=1 Tax=Silene latifolia TaxID=37657 RepID=UPI003D76A989
MSNNIHHHWQNNNINNINNNENISNSNSNSNNSSNNNNSNNINNNNNGPCGACKYLRRKCVRGCVFAPYFDSDQGTAHFAAVHKVFGASNASKLLLRIPVHKRLDAVVTLCYEALSRVRDPVYGCVSHIFSLQQQVLNMQAELAFVQARLSTLQRAPPPYPMLMDDHASPEVLLDQISSCSTATTTSTTATSIPFFDNMLHSQLVTSSTIPPTTEMAAFYNTADQQYDDMLLEDGDLQTLTREFVSKYLPGVKFKSEPN